MALNVIAKSFENYRSTHINFDNFHNQVINMPRATFSELPEVIKLLKSLASYILLIDEKVLTKKINPKEIYHNIFSNFKCGKVPTKNRNISFEETFLNINDTFERVYDENVWKMGRRFRHYTELFSFFDILKRVKVGNKWSKNYGVFDVDALKELELTDEADLFDLFRNKLLNLNVKDNSHIVTCKGIKLKNDVDYRPARAILRYILEMDREVTDFEIGILLGRIDDVQKEDEILVRANNIGKELPHSFGGQINLVFDSMLWKTSGGARYSYRQSQNPDFKFKSFIILMETFGMISYDRNSHFIALTEYSKELMQDEIPLDVLDLEHLLVKIDSDTADSKELTDLILKRRTDAITAAIQADGELVEKINIRNIHNPPMKNGKRIRSKLIMEVAKIKVNYIDEVEGVAPFVGKSGTSYVEAHHIIEFGRECGPDITDNLICLGPSNHSLIHHGDREDVVAFFNRCRTSGAIVFHRFEIICTKYHCLTKDHVKALLKKGLITEVEKNNLEALIDENGVDPLFLKSLEITATESY
jgi:hypothetical protein